MHKLLALLLTLPLSLTAQGFDIAYTLPKDGKVSLAVYDARGRMIRTLKSGDEQKAGKQSVKWDGLMSDGQAAPAGEYDWKLLLSQGMKAEYLLSLGTSVGIDHWTAQHGGPYAVAALPDGEVIVGGSTEGSPMIVRLNPQTSRTTWVNDVWGGGGVHDLAVLDGVVYAVGNAGTVKKFDVATGKLLPGELPLVLAVEDLGEIQPTQETKVIEFSPKVGSFKIRSKITLGQGGGALKIRAGGQVFPLARLKATKEVAVTVPEKNGFLDGAKTSQIVFEGGPFMNDWSASSVEIISKGTRIAAWEGTLAGVFKLGESIAWMDLNGKVLAKAKVPAPSDIELLDAQTALVISGNDVLEVKRDGTQHTVITGLVSPNFLSVDRNSGQIFIAENAPSHQVKRFSKDGKLEATFGLEKGRKTGIYVADNFRDVAGISADGQGGFWICEGTSAPRRTAHFDANGKLLGEWYGGQRFYTFAAADPEDPDIIWMDSQWGWIMQVKVDWDKRNWKVLATYGWADQAPGDLVNRDKGAEQHQVKRLDLDKDGTKETYLVSNLGIQKVDEAAGLMRVISTMGVVSPGLGFDWDKQPLEKQSKPWVEALTLLGEDPAKVFKKYRAFAWADANGDYRFQPEEMRVAKDAAAEGKGGFYLTEDLSVLKSSGWGGKEGVPDWEVYPLQGLTASHAPIWDWNIKTPGPVMAPGNPKDFFVSGSGDIYQIVFGVEGDGYSALDTFGMGHGSGWPSNLADATSVIKWTPEGTPIWKVGFLPSNANRQPGRLFYPVHFAGLVNGTIGVCDKMVQPVVFWTEDGLYAGGLFDRRADDGLPKRVYSWWTGGTDGFDPETGRALFQYDMFLGGSLIKRPNGDVIFIGSGWNNCPAYRVTGWDEFERQAGKVKVTTPVVPAPQKGSGLLAEFYANPGFQGKPAYELKMPQVWMEPERSVKKDRPELQWPNQQIPKAPGLGHVPDEGLDLEVPERPVLDGKFSTRWSGFVEPRFSEEYRFAVYRKGGTARLWVNDQLVTEPSEKGAKDFSKLIALEAGRKYPIKLEWSGEPTGEIHLNWESFSQQLTHIPVGSLYPAEPK